MKRSAPEKLPTSVLEDVNLPSSRMICALAETAAERPVNVGVPIFAGTYLLPTIETSKPFSQPVL
jgi:hypothetical protein